MARVFPGLNRRRRRVLVVAMIAAGLRPAFRFDRRFHFAPGAFSLSSGSSYGRNTEPEPNGGYDAGRMLVRPVGRPTFAR